MLSMRSTLVLCALTLLLAAWACWAVATAGMLPAFWLANPALAPHLVAGFAIAVAAFAAPFIFTQEELSAGGVWLYMLKAAQAALWLAIAAAFMMLTVSRVSPINSGGIAHASLWIFFAGWCAIALNRIAPRAANAVLFLWLVALPVSAYMLAEVFLTSPAGGTGLAESTAQQAAALRMAIRCALNFSPGTGALGGLTGSLADGSEYSFSTAAITMFAIAVVSIAIILRKEKNRSAGATEQHPAPC